jgi:hypothetical protein
VVRAVVTAKLLALGGIPVSVGVPEVAIGVAKDSLDTGDVDVISATKVTTDTDVRPAKVDVSLMEEEEAEGEGASVVVWEAICGAIVWMDVIICVVIITEPLGSVVMLVSEDIDV